MGAEVVMSAKDANHQMLRPRYQILELESLTDTHEKGSQTQIVRQDKRQLKLYMSCDLIMHLFRSRATYFCSCVALTPSVTTITMMILSYKA